jgi:hypothetical protein
MDLSQKKTKIDSEFWARWEELVKAARELVPDSPFKFEPEATSFHVTKPRTKFEQARLTMEKGKVSPPPGLDCALEQTPHRVEVQGRGGFKPSEPSYLFDADDSGVFLLASQSHKKLDFQEAAKAIVGPFLKRYK